MIVGAKDPATLPEYGLEIAKMVKGAKVTSLEAAHLSNIEKPKAYTEAVLNFLKRRIRQNGAAQIDPMKAFRPMPGMSRRARK